MTLPASFLDELRARTTLSTLIQATVPLRRAGREWKACCPFHNEKSPSFHVNDEKGFYHCFGCSAHGDAIRWLTDHRGLQFMDAVRELADAAGLDVPARDPRAAERSDELDRARAVMLRAAEHFRSNLHGAAGATARDYLASRGIDATIAREFGIGFAVQTRRGDRPDLLGTIRDVQPACLVQLGLVKARDDGDDTNSLYDFFRQRIMVPIQDARGRVIAFGGRILGDGQPKYLNSPDTPLFDKGRTLFNLHRAAPASRKTGRLVVVEGYMDVIAMARGGIMDCVAPNGTALTMAQLELLWRQVPAPILCFDGDSAGKAAARRAARLALPELTPERTLRFVSPPDGQDPDDVIRENGASALSGMLAAPRELIDILWEEEAAAVALDTPEGRAALLDSVGKLAAAIKHPGLSLEYLREFKARFASIGRRQARTSVRHQPRSGLNAAIEAAVLVGLCRHPDVLAADYEAIAGIRWRYEDAGRLADALIDVAMKPPVTADSISIHLEGEGLADLARQAVTAARVPFTFVSATPSEATARELREALGQMPR